MNRWEDQDQPADWEDETNGDDEYAEELDEGPQSVDLEELGEDDETEVVACPHCGREVYEDAERCPHCGQYILPDQAHAAGGWVWAILVGLILAVLQFWLRC